MKRSLWGFLLLGLLAALPDSARAQRPPRPAPTPTLGLDQGYLEFDTPDFALKLVRASQTVAALRPKLGDGRFDFTPADRLTQRAGDGFHHLGDLTFRTRSEGGDWQDYSTAKARKPVAALPAGHALLASADLAPTLPADCPLRVVRAWSVEGGRLVLRFRLTNKSDKPIELGAVGLPMVFNNIITDRRLEEAHERCSFFDPYIGQDAGYLQVTRLSGKGPALVVAPDGKTPFEGWQPLSEPMRPNQTFEGTFAWLAHTKAYAEREWKDAQPWNPPTAARLASGESRVYGVRFLVAGAIRDIEKSLAAARRPVAVGVPGYILPMDVDAKLFLKYGKRVKGIAVEPAGAIEVAPAGGAKGWAQYTLRGKLWGRARVAVTYDDGTEQAIHCYVIKPAREAVGDLGRFLLTRQWFEQPDDPFGRSPSVISYDRQADKQVTQDSRVWIAGLGDEGGSGSWLAAAMKLFGQPEKEQVAQYERFVDKVLWGGLQFKDGPNAYGVRKSLFYYQPDQLPDFPYDTSRDWRSWTSWNKKASEDIGRGYNYPHVVAAYWSLYRIARNHPGLATAHPWQWYLEQATKTTAFAFSRDEKGERRVGWVELGLMEGTVFLALLDDLKREGWAPQAAQVEALMRERAERWSHEAYPFGSEMAWDSTGQEEVYAWCRYFGHEDKAQVSLSAILGYMPTLPHWGYNGNARRYWDFLYGGKTTRIERQLHHYGSGLNALPVLTEFRAHPDDFYLLRVGYGGMMGALSNIDQGGFASVAFHSYPSTLKWDAYSGDYGPNFFGHALNAATYLVRHTELGWLSFGGNVASSGERATMTPRDAFRQRVFVAPLGLWLTLDAGTFESVEVDLRARTVAVVLSPATADTPQARLRIERPSGGDPFAPKSPLTLERGAYTVPLTAAPTRVELAAPA